MRHFNGAYSIRAGYHGPRKPRLSMESAGLIRTCACGQLLFPDPDATNPFTKTWPRNCPRCNADLSRRPA
mgnify:FL=1